MRAGPHIQIAQIEAEAVSWARVPRQKEGVAYRHYKVLWTGPGRKLTSCYARMSSTVAGAGVHMAEALAAGRVRNMLPKLRVCTSFYLTPSVIVPDSNDTLLMFGSSHHFRSPASQSAASGQMDVASSKIDTVRSYILLPSLCTESGARFGSTLKWSIRVS